MSIDRLKRFLTIFLIHLLALLSFACNATPASQTPGATLAETVAVLPTETNLPQPTATDLQPLLILIAPAEADAELTSSLQGTLTELATQAGLRFQVRPSLAPEEFENVRLVVALPPDPGLAQLAQSAPDTQFLAIGIAGLEPAANLSVIGAQSGRPDQVGFLAGYTAAAITTDWRVAVVSQAGTPAGGAYRLGYTNGVFYFCGLCRSVYPPFPTTGYPLYIELPAGAGPADWQSAITYFNTWQAETVFVDPAVADEAFLDQLAQAGFNLILVGPPPTGLNERWVASIGTTDPLESLPHLLDSLLSGEGGANTALPIGFSGVNPDLLSPGRQRLAEAMLADLLAGYIDTGVNPETGEAR